MIFSNRRRLNRSPAADRSLENLVEQSNLEEKRQREDQLFDIINELLTQKKRDQRGRPKKKKKLRLFDVIDNIPITSNSDSDDESDCRHGVKYNDRKESPQHIDRHTYRTLKKYGITRNLDFGAGTKSDKSIPSSVPHIPFQDKTQEKPINKSNFQTLKINGLEETQRLNEDPFSWKTLVQEFRHESKSTQTDSKNKTMDHLHTKEVQTELKEMLDIPKTQTFFLEPTPSVSNEKTKEFCDRVRKEVIEKLEYQEKLEDKKTQTVSYACTQTDVLQEDSSNSYASPQSRDENVNKFVVSIISQYFPKDSLVCEVFTYNVAVLKCRFAMCTESWTHCLHTKAC